MGKLHGKNAYFKWGSDDLSAYVSDISLPRSLEEVDVTTFTATAKSFVVGLQDNKLTVKGPWDDTLDGKFGPDFNAGTSRAVEVAANGGTPASSNPVYKWATAYLTEYTIEAGVGGAVTYSASIRLNGTVDRDVTP